MPNPYRRRAFTLLELLVVIGIIVALTLLLAPAFTTRKRAQDVTYAAYAIKGVLEQARAYAMANDTYTWVGFYEEDSTSIAPTNSTPAYPGKGRLLLASVYSIDGTKVFNNDDASAPLPADRIKQLGKLTRIEGLHLTDLGSPTPTPSPSPLPNTLDGRSNLPYTENSHIVPPADHYNRISSDSTDTTKFKFIAQGYTFYKTLRFTPRGEANINSTYDLRRVAEIGLRPAHGTVIDRTTPNVVAIQFTGTGGIFQIYRR
jgi:prepilin-type N-terminal cleavage/methylation domain-containing protein